MLAFCDCGAKKMTTGNRETSSADFKTQHGILTSKLNDSEVNIVFCSMTDIELELVLCEY